MNLINLPIYVIWHIFDKLRYEDLLSSCTISRKYNSLCRDPEYWRHRIECEFGLVSQCHYQHTYREIRNYHNNGRIYLREAIERHDDQIVKFYVDQLILHKTSISECVYLLAKDNYANILDDLLLKFPEESTNAIRGAAAGNYREMMYKLVFRRLQSGENLKYILSVALDEAGRCGHINLVKELIDEGADRSLLNGILQHIIDAGNYELTFKLMSLTNFDPEFVLIGATRCKQWKLVLELIKRYPDVDATEAIDYIITSDHPEMIFILLDRCPADLDLILLRVIKCRRMNLIDELIKRGANLEYVLGMAKRCHDIELIGILKTLST